MLSTVESSRLGLLWEIHGRRLRTWTHRLAGNQVEGEDLLQDVFVRACKSFPSYDQGRLFWPWIAELVLATYNSSVKRRMRREGLATFVSLDSLLADSDQRYLRYLVIPPEEHPDAILLRNEVYGVLEKAILTVLTPLERGAVVNAYYRGMTHIKSAESLGFGSDFKVIDNALKRAKKKLKKELEDV
jgi:RNA polymerase sigma factor (sigma-70 family)